MRQLQETKDQAQKLLEQAHKILCITSSKSGVDGIASVATMQQWLVSQGKEVTAVFPGDIPKNLDFLNGLESLQTKFTRQGNVVISVAGGDAENLDYKVASDGSMKITLPVDKDAVSLTQETEKYDLIVCLEVGQLMDLGEIYESQISFFQETPLINIAANGHNDFYAKLNLVDTTASSTSEVVYGLMSATTNEIQSDLATILLSGVIASSGSFLGENTTASAFVAAAELQTAGGAQSDIIENIYKKKSLKTLKLWGQVFNRLEFDTTHRITRSTLHKTDFSMLEATPENIENLTTDILRYIDGSDIFVCVYEWDNTIFVQIRTTDRALNWEEIFVNHPYQTVVGGANAQFAGAHLSEIEKEIFARLVDYQAVTKSLSGDCVYETCQANQNQPTLDIKVPEDKMPKAPETIPFEAPFQPHENETPHTKDWLKENFPKN